MFLPVSTRNFPICPKLRAGDSKKSAYQDADEFFDELDIYIRNKYADQPDKINAWNNAAHIERTTETNDGEESGGKEGIKDE